MRVRDLPRHGIALIEVAAHRLRHGNKPMFTRDWTTWHSARWKEVLTPADRPIEILEVGSFEGRSARFFLDAFPHARVTCVDPFPPARSAKFDHNTWPHHARLIKLRGRSAAVLDRLISENRRYDAIYIDGSHKRIAVMTDSVQAWELLKVGGVLIWDDYRWEMELPSEKRPQHAIDAFCRTFAPCIRELHNGYQVIVEKTADWPTTSHVPVDGEAEALV
jgi:predicted O-methyltransferase YrrM